MAHYETTDIFKGAFLLSKGGDLSGISFNGRQLSDGRRLRIATFAISGEDLHQLEQDYMTGKALVNPLILRQSLNHLRDLLFDMRDRRKTNDRTRANRRHQRRR